MSQRELNLGIVAHVDAGKTTLTERLLYEAGVIDEIGSVDAGTTQTDTLDLERQRGITIKSAVTSFALGDVHVNLIDTPGHPDFIAEVERVLSVLDGAVLVISAVEGVQPQTRILMRALQRLRIPTLLFVNKIDRAGAGEDRVLRAIAERLGAAVVPMSAPDGLGTRDAFVKPLVDDPALHELLAENDEALLESFVDDESDVSQGRLLLELASQTRRVLVHPVFFGSALTGAGVDAVMTGIVELLPSSEGDADAAPAASVFKIERAPNGEKVAYVRMFSGTIRTRDRVSFGSGLEGKVTTIAVFEQGPAVQRQSVAAGGVAKLWGLADVQIGDRIGESGAAAMRPQFPPPTLESVVVATNPDDRARLRSALTQLAEQDPLINVQQNEVLNEDSVSLYGEVQKEVIESTLETDFGLEVDFQSPRRSTSSGRCGAASRSRCCTRRRTRSAPRSASESIPHHADSGFEFRLDIDPLTAPLYLYKTLNSFSEHMARYVRETLREGLHGWQVTDCVVTMTQLRVQRAGRPSVEARPAQHEQRLPQADADRAHAGARAGADERVRAGRPREARGSRGVGRRRPRGRRPTRCAGRDGVAARRPGHGRHGPVDPRRAGAPATAVEPDERRGRARNDLPRLRAGQRRPSDPPAKDGERAQPRGVHAPCREPCVSIAAAQRYPNVMNFRR